MKRFHFIIFLLIGFMLLGLTRRAFACPYLGSSFTDSSGTWTVSNSCYDTAAAASAAWSSASLYSKGGPYSTPTDFGGGTCTAPPGVTFYVGYGYPVGSHEVSVFWVRAAGDSCGDLASRLESECGGPGTFEINTELCTGHCYPTSECAQAYEQACLRCGSCDQIAYFDNSKCIGVCEDCKDEYEQRKQECSNPWPDDERDACSYTCSCTSKVDEAEQACPFGFSMDDQCNYSCLSCTDLQEQCISQCNGRDNVDTMVCEDVNKIPKDYLCICKQDNCDAFYDSCHAACDVPECGGIKVSKCVESGGEITYTRCECNGCSKPPENPDGPPPGDGEPTPEPGDGGDIIAWLKAIKGDTGILVRQGDEHTAWFSSIKGNGDRTNEILERIAGKNTSVDVNVDTAGVVNAIGVTNQKLTGIGQTASSINEGVGTANQKLDGIGGTLTDIRDGFSGLGIGTKVEGDYSVSEGSYGTAPTDSDLPTKEVMDSAFGTYTPPEDSNRDLIKNTISGFIPQVGSSECNISISLPVPTLSGLSWHSYSLNFCQYEAIFVMIGNALVFLTALYELYSLA
ncbi:MAG TPA: hypothetical protein VLS45_01480 [Methylomicrobium sp.]|nr:hypothetical protein [Methylomicrobium sp.]